jgi:hypothetical protein
MVKSEPALWLLAGSIVGCHEGAPAPATSPVAVVIDRSAASAAPPVAPPAPAASAAAEPAADESCEEQMFDHPPGTSGLHAFEDAASGKWGYRDETGKVVVAPRFHTVYEFSPEGIAGAYGDEGPVFIDKTGRVLARALDHDNGPDYFVAGRARIVKDGKVGFIDKQGRVVIEPRYEFATQFCRARAAVCAGCKERREGEITRMEGGRWGYIDWHGRPAIPQRFESATGFSEDGEAHVTEGGRRRVIDPSGRVLREGP